MVEPRTVAWLPAQPAAALASAGERRGPVQAILDEHGRRWTVGAS